MKKYDIGTAQCYSVLLEKEDRSVLIVLIDMSIYVVAADELLDDDIYMLEYVDCTSITRAYNVWLSMIDDIKVRSYDGEYYNGRNKLNNKTLLQLLLLDKRLVALGTMRELVRSVMDGVYVKGDVKLEKK